PSDQRPELEQSTAEYEAVLGLEPDHVLAGFQISQAYGLQGRAVDAATMSARVADRRPDSFPANVLAGQRFLAAYGPDAAQPYMVRARAALDHMPPPSTFPPAQRAYVLLFPAHELWVRRRVHDAAAFLDRARLWPELAEDGDHAFALLGGLELAL